MSQEILKYSVDLNISFVSLIGSNGKLPFKIPVANQELVLRFPDILELGKAEYGCAIDMWLDGTVSSASSETATVVLDSNWQLVLEKVCNLTVFLNQKGASSQISLRPDFTGMYLNTLVVKGEAKAQRSQIPSAIKELISKFHSTAYLLFSKHCPEIPGFASCRDQISLHSIFFCGRDRVFCEKPVKIYDTSNFDMRLMFIQDLFKIAIWIVSQREPIQRFHLVPDVRMVTRNAHHITFVNGGIVKEFKNIESIPMNIIKSIYLAKLLNVEQGHANCSSITITSIGRRVKDALEEGYVTKTDVLMQTQAAVNQLHSLGFAHCDICLDNIFVNLETGVVFLGDLEYCQLMDQNPPKSLRRSDSRARTAGELDTIQLEKLELELEIS